MLIPVDNPRDNKNKKAVNVLTLISNLCSKNSYAVNTFNLLNKGTNVMHKITIAMGKPK